MRAWILAAVATVVFAMPASAQFVFPGSGSKSSSMPQFTPFFTKPNFGGITSKPAMPGLMRPTSVFSSFPSFSSLFSSRGGPTSQPQLILPPPKKK
ncbi:MAG: hypothetical protein EXS16_18690 [Gemmataceae bacterium]|nr:hypothetical protein [Gemmataceae bacterium]